MPIGTIKWDYEFLCSSTLSKILNILFHATEAAEAKVNICVKQAIQQPLFHYQALTKSNATKETNSR